MNDRDSTDFSVHTTLHLAQSDRAVRAVGFSLNGDLVATVSDDDNHSVAVFDWKKGKMLAQVKGDNNPILALAW
jgi:Ser/Thr protein kinase RdoA (MazF antagonist)